MNIHRVVYYIFSYFSKRKEPISAVMKYQLNTLTDRMSENDNTVFGRTHRFSKICNFDEFRTNIPLHTYDDLQPYIEHMMQGKTDILRHGKIPFFSKSSGTTARSKFIPITKKALQRNNYACGKAIVKSYLTYRKDSKLFLGQCLVMGGRLADNPYCPGVKNIGDVSAILQYCAPFMGKMRRKPSLEVGFLEDFEVKLEAMIGETKNSNITFAAGVPSWLTLFFERLCERTDNQTVLDVWPSFELLLWGGVSIEPYKERLKKLFPGDQVQYWQTYNASEGFFAYQDLPHADDMLLAVKHHVLYEFIPFENVNEDQPDTLLLDEVKVGHKYEIVITTDGGLRRYRLGDVVKFTSIDPHKIQIVGRTKAYINIYGEEVMVHNTDEAMSRVTASLGLTGNEYVVVPYVTDTEGYHERRIELGESSDVPDEKIMAEMLDKELRSINSDYDAKRTNDILMKELTVHFVAPGTFHSWMQEQGKLGGQHKLKRLRASRNEFDEAIGKSLQKAKLTPHGKGDKNN